MRQSHGGGSGQNIRRCLFAIESVAVYISEKVMYWFVNAIVDGKKDETVVRSDWIVRDEEDETKFRLRWPRKKRKRA